MFWRRDRRDKADDLDDVREDAVDEKPDDVESMFYHAGLLKRLMEETN